MKAILVREFGDYREKANVEEIDIGNPGPNEVLIANKAAGVSFATSLVIAGLYQRKPPLPFTPGTEAAGIVTAIGAEVTRVAVGDHVMCNIDEGGHAEQILASELCCQKIPTDMDFGAATMIILSYTTSYGALTRRAQLQAGETLLVHGAAGAVGMAAVEIGKALGTTVIAVAGGPEHCEVARRHGADHVIDHRETNFRDVVMDVTGGRGVDVVYDSIGGEVTRQSIRSMAPEGRLLTIGYASGTIPEIPANLLLVKNISALGFNLGHFFGWSPGGKRADHIDIFDDFVTGVLDLYAQGKINPEVGRSYPLTEFVDAMDAVLARQINGKCVVHF